MLCSLGPDLSALSLTSYRQTIWFKIWWQIHTSDIMFTCYLPSHTHTQSLGLSFKNSCLSCVRESDQQPDEAVSLSWKQRTKDWKWVCGLAVQSVVWAEHTIVSSEIGLFVVMTTRCVAQGDEAMAVERWETESICSLCLNGLIDSDRTNSQRPWTPEEFIRRSLKLFWWSSSLY